MVQTRADTDDTQRIILNAARRLFLAHGYRAVSTRQIAEGSGVTQAALYHFFRGKEGLYVAVLRDELARLYSGLSRILAREARAPDKLDAAARFLLATTDYDFALMQHDIEAELGPEARALIAGEFVTHLLAPLVAMIAEGQARGDLRTGGAGGAGGMTAERAAGVFLSLVSHYISSPIPTDPAPARRAPGNIQAAARELVGFLLYGLAQERPHDA